MRLRLGLRRSLICFAPLAIVPQRQVLVSFLPSLSVFLLISTHFTATPEVPETPPTLKRCHLLPQDEVKPRHLRQDVQRRLRDTLRPVNSDNACALRITATAGT
jgi:hypothetical protein